MAKQDGVSVNQFIVIAVTEKISALETAEFFADRLRQADKAAFRQLLLRAGGEIPRAGDEID